MCERALCSNSTAGLRRRRRERVHVCRFTGWVDVALCFRHDGLSGSSDGDSEVKAYDPQI